MAYQSTLDNSFYKITINEADSKLTRQNKAVVDANNALLSAKGLGVTNKCVCCSNADGLEDNSFYFASKDTWVGN